MFSGGYHIIFVPRNAEKTKRFHFSSFTARLIAFGSILFIPLVVGALFAAVHYQNKVVSLRGQMAEEQEILEQKEILGSRLTRLERSLSRTNDSLLGLEKLLQVEKGQVTGGLGPIDQEIQIKEFQEMPTIMASIGTLLETDMELSAYDIRSQTNELSRKISDLQARTTEIYQLNEDKIRFLEATPNTMPVDGWVTSGFGFRRSPYSGSYKMHYGIDVASPVGTTIRAPADGKVIMAEFKGGYGRKAILEHGYGVNTVFAHASELFVKEGQLVKRGDIIAAVGSSGSSTGPHLHYEVHVDGIPTDPVKYIWK